MIIKKITFENFRSFYEKTVIDINDGLSLFIGDNGDGKTTFIEALEWLFKTETDIMNRDLVSMKKISELSVGENAMVRVAMEYEHDGWKKVEKSFMFEKEDDISTNSIKLHSYDFKGYKEVGSERITVAGSDLLKVDFDSSVKEYSLFKGEHNLNVFSGTTALSFLVETFSDIRRFKPLLGERIDDGFLPSATKSAQSAHEREVRKSTTNQNKERRLRAEIDKVRKDIANAEKRLKTYEENAHFFERKLNELEDTSQAGKRLDEINKNLASLEDEAASIRSRIDENYAPKLLDEMWILFEAYPLLREFQEKIHSVSKLRRSLQNKHHNEEIEKKTLLRIAEGIREKTFTPLEVLVPDEYTMREMIDEEICKVCGREALKGSDAHIFMIDKLNKLLDSQKKDEDKEIPKLFPNNYLKDLERISNQINYNGVEISDYKSSISDKIDLNNFLKKSLVKKEKQIEDVETDKYRLLSEHSQFSEDQLVNNHKFVRDWVDGKHEAELQSKDIEVELKDLKTKLANFENQYNKLSVDENTILLSKVSRAFENIQNAFSYAKERNTQDFLKNLEKTANKYLENINVDGFRGIIRIRQYGENQLSIQLRDIHDTLITSPNQSLKTTMYISVLFAVSELTSVKRDNNYPLIFDAPTSSFAAPMEKEFFKVISSEANNLNKQIVILSKSYLKDNGELELEQIKELDATVYRVKKLEPFDKTDLSTIQTIIEEIP